MSIRTALLFLLCSVLFALSSFVTPEVNTPDVVTLQELVPLEGVEQLMLISGDEREETRLLRDRENSSWRLQRKEAAESFPVAKEAMNVVESVWRGAQLQLYPVANSTFLATSSDKGSAKVLTVITSKGERSLQFEEFNSFLSKWIITDKKAKRTYLAPQGFYRIFSSVGERYVDSNATCGLSEKQVSSLTFTTDSVEAKAKGREYFLSSDKVWRAKAGVPVDQRHLRGLLELLSRQQEGMISVKEATELERKAVAHLELGSTETGRGCALKVLRLADSNREFYGFTRSDSNALFRMSPDFTLRWFDDQAFMETSPFKSFAREIREFSVVQGERTFRVARVADEGPAQEATAAVWQREDGSEVDEKFVKGWIDSLYGLPVVGYGASTNFSSGPSLGALTLRGNDGEDVTLKVRSALLVDKELRQVASVECSAAFCPILIEQHHIRRVLPKAEVFSVMSEATGR